VRDDSGCLVWVVLFAVVMAAWIGADVWAADRALEDAEHKRFMSDCKAHGRPEFECTALWRKK
jgi:hypothetical protein